MPHGGTPAIFAMTIIGAMSALKGSAQTSLIAATSATCTALNHIIEWLEGIAESKNAVSGLHADVCWTKGATKPNAVAQK